MMLQTTSIVAVVQAAPVPYNTPETLGKVDALTREAAAREAKLVLFPEAFVGGYPRGLTFGASVGNRSSTGRDQYHNYWESAIDVPGDATRQLGEIAARYGVYVVIGVIERSGGTLYCSIVFFAPDGSYLGKHRKLMPTGSERLIWGFGDGSTMPVFDTPLGRIGAVVCWENYMPLVRVAYYAKGIQLYLAPTADARDTWLSTMIHVALEGRCFVLSSNQYCRRSDYPAEYSTHYGDEPDTVMSRGGSCIISPLGEVLAGPNYDGDAILTAPVDLREIARGKFDFDVTGHYARPDIFQLTVDESASTPVVFTSDSERPQR